VVDEKVPGMQEAQMLLASMDVKRPIPQGLQDVAPWLLCEVPLAHG
jgi:hypothetical protein